MAAVSFFWDTSIAAVTSCEQKGVFPRLALVA